MNNQFVEEKHPLLSEYNSKVYSNKDRWVSYFWQIKLVQDLISTGKILEVGIGTSTVNSYFKNNNYEVTTVDIDDRLKPDYVCSVEDLHLFSNDSFDLVICAEVLEHLPFDRLEISLRELKRVSKKYLVISLPYWGYTFGFKLKLPFLGQKTFKFKVSGLKRHAFNGQHYWEIGKKGFPLSKVVAKFTLAGLKVKKSFWDLDDPYHYYFVLEK